MIEKSKIKRLISNSISHEKFFLKDGEKTFTPTEDDIELIIRNAILESFNHLLKQNETSGIAEMNYRLMCIEELQKYWEL